MENVDLFAELATAFIDAAVVVIAVVWMLYVVIVKRSDEAVQARSERLLILLWVVLIHSSVDDVLEILEGVVL